MKAYLSTIKDSAINALEATCQTVGGASVSYVMGQLAGYAYRVKFPGETGSFDHIAPAIFASSFYVSYRVTNRLVRRLFKLNDLFDSSLIPTPKRAVCFATQFIINASFASAMSHYALQALQAPYKLSNQDYAIFTIATSLGLLVHTTSVKMAKIIPLLQGNSAHFLKKDIINTKIELKKYNLDSDTINKIVDACCYLNRSQMTAKGFKKCLNKEMGNKVSDNFKNRLFHFWKPLIIFDASLPHSHIKNFSMLNDSIKRSISNYEDSSFSPFFVRKFNFPSPEKDDSSTFSSTSSKDKSSSS